MPRLSFVLKHVDDMSSDVSATLRARALLPRWTEAAARGGRSLLRQGTHAMSPCGGAYLRCFASDALSQVGAGSAVMEGWRAAEAEIGKGTAWGHWAAVADPQPGAEELGDGDGDGCKAALIAAVCFSYGSVFRNTAPDSCRGGCGSIIADDAMLAVTFPAVQKCAW